MPGPAYTSPLADTVPVRACHPGLKVPELVEGPGPAYTALIADTVPFAILSFKTYNLIP